MRAGCLLGLVVHGGLLAAACCVADEWSCFKLLLQVWRRLVWMRAWMRQVLAVQRVCVCQPCGCWRSGLPAHVCAARSQLQQQLLLLRLRQCVYYRSWWKCNSDQVLQWQLAAAQCVIRQRPSSSLLQLLSVEVWRVICAWWGWMVHHGVRRVAYACWLCQKLYVSTSEATTILCWLAGEQLQHLLLGPAAVWLCFWLSKDITSHSMRCVLETCVAVAVHKRVACQPAELGSSPLLTMPRVQGIMACMQLRWVCDLCCWSWWRLVLTNSGA